jgi:hypothetical protein
MIEGQTDEETIAVMMHVLGVSEAQARFILAIERGEIGGDVVDVADAGDEQS